MYTGDTVLSTVSDSSRVRRRLSLRRVTSSYLLHHGRRRSLEKRRWDRVQRYVDVSNPALARFHPHTFPPPFCIILFYSLESIRVL